MILLKTQQECFIVFLGKTVKEKERVIPPNLAQQIWQNAPQSWVSIPLKWVLTRTKGCFQQDGGYCNSKVGLGLALGLSPARQSPNWS